MQPGDITLRQQASYLDASTVEPLSSTLRLQPHPGKSHEHILSHTCPGFNGQPANFSSFRPSRNILSTRAFFDGGVTE